MTTILVLARQPLAQFPFQEVAARHQVHLIAHPNKTGWSTLDDDSRRRFASAAVYNRYDTNDLLLRHAAELIEKHGVEQIVALSEVDVLRAGELRTRYGLPGLGAVESLRFRDKIIMKETLAAAGVLVPRSRQVGSGLDLLDARDEFGFPFVLKPRCGGGSVGTVIIEDDRQLDLVLDQGLRSRFFLPAALEAEEFVEGKMFHVDGLVLDGDIAMVWPSVYRTSTLQHSTGVPLSSAQLPHTHAAFDDLVTLTRRVLELLGATNHGVDVYFHCEIFDGPEGLTFCEIGARPGGIGVVDCLDGKYDTSSFGHIMGRIDGTVAKLALSPRQESFGWIGVPANRSIGEGVAAIPADAVHSKLSYDRGKNRGQPSISSVDVEGMVCVRAVDAATVNRHLDAMAEAYGRKPGAQQ